MKIKIKDLEYVIVEETDGDNVFCDKITDGQSQMRLGLCDFVNQKICLHEHMTRTRKRKVLAHELTHAFDEEQLCEFIANYSKEINEICDHYFNA